MYEIKDSYIFIIDFFTLITASIIIVLTGAGFFFSRIKNRSNKN